MSVGVVVEVGVRVGVRVEVGVLVGVEVAVGVFDGVGVTGSQKKIRISLGAPASV